MYERTSDGRWGRQFSNVNVTFFFFSYSIEGMLCGAELPKGVLHDSVYTWWCRVVRLNCHLNCSGDELRQRNGKTVRSFCRIWQSPREGRIRLDYTHLTRTHRFGRSRARNTKLPGVRISFHQRCKGIGM